VIIGRRSAAEERDPFAGLLDLVSDDFRDDRAAVVREELKQYLRRLPRHAPVRAPAHARRQHRVPVSGLRRWQLTVGTLGARGGGCGGIATLPGRIEVALELRLEGDEWKVNARRVGSPRGRG